MKHIKLFESFEDVESICSKYGITNYTVNSDGSIDVDGNVDLSRKKLTKLPLKFGNVTGYFYCSSNQLTTLEGSPKEVGGYFDCYNNQLTTLEGSPKEVGGDFYCNHNQLTTLEGSPKEVGGGFYCQFNQLTSLKGGPSKLGGDFYCSNNKLPKLILDNIGHIKKIVEYQEDYLIWRSNGSLDEYKFNDMMEEINDEI